MIHKSLSRLIIPFLVLSIILPAFSAQPASSFSPGYADIQNNPDYLLDKEPFLQLIQVDEKKITIQLTPAYPQFQMTSVDGQACETISIPELPQSESSGLPALPVQGAMLGIPPDAQPTIKILSTDAIDLPSSHDLCPTPQPVFDRSTDGPWKLTSYTYERAAFYQHDAFLPASVAELVSVGNIRSQRIAEIRFNPLQYNPVSGEVRYLSRIQVEVEFNSAQAAAGMQPDSSILLDEGKFEDSLQRLLLNYEQARPWRLKPAADAQVSASPASFTNPVYKIELNQDGIYQLSYADLQAAGLPINTLDPRTFRIYDQDAEIAIYVDGEVDGDFEPGEFLLFYGQKVDSKYTDTNVYWLSWAGVNGLRMDSKDGTPLSSFQVPADFLTTHHAEIDTPFQYYPDGPSGPTKDHWYWGSLYAKADTGSVSLEFTADLPHRSSLSHTATLRGLIKGYFTNYMHHTRIYINNNLIDDHLFTPTSEYNFILSLPQSYLNDGTNTLRVECPYDGLHYDEVLFNWFEIDYYDTYYAETDRFFFDGDQAGSYEYHVDGFSEANLEAFDITTPQAPILISGEAVQSTANGYQLAFEDTIPGERNFLAQATSQRLSPLDISLDSPSSWKSTSNGADYLIISHASFLSALQPLADYRDSQLPRVQMVDVQDLYDEFNGGVFSPEAIKSFLEYAYASWTPPAPSYVLLVGDGHLDFKNIYGENEPNYIPPYMDDIDPWIGETATDNRYVSVSGADILPDMYIGRFPARTLADAQTMVSKTINYETIPPSGGWNARQTFVAENPDSAGNFPALSDLIINTFVPDNYAVEKIHYGVNYFSPATARAALKNAVNQGTLVLHFYGHGSTDVWASELLLKVSDLPLLTNGNKLPFFMPLTCLDGYFVWPQLEFSSLGESAVSIDGRGAIASWSPTGYGLSAGQHLLDSYVYDDLFNQNQNQLGYLTTHAKYNLYNNNAGHHDELVESYLLFGDPALRLWILPAAPSNLTAMAVSMTQIDLTWQDNSNDEFEFRIERSLDGLTGWQQIAVVNAGVTSYSDLGFNCLTLCHYRVRAFRSSDGQFSAYSNTTSARTANQTIFLPLVVRNTP